MPTALTDDILAAVRGMNQAAQSASPDTDGKSAGTRWPDDGDCSAWVKDFKIALESFRYEGNEIPGILYAFRFETLDQPDGDNWEFDGSAFRFPLNYDNIKATLPPKTRTRCEIQLNRLMGHLTSLLGHRPATLENGVTEFAKGFNKASPPAVTLRITSRTTKDKSGRDTTYRTEFISGVLSVESMTA